MVKILSEFYRIYVTKNRSQRYYQVAGFRLFGAHFMFIKRNYSASRTDLGLKLVIRDVLGDEHSRFLSRNCC